MLDAPYCPECNNEDPTCEVCHGGQLPEMKTESMEEINARRQFLHELHMRTNEMLAEGAPQSKLDGFS